LNEAKDNIIKNKVIAETKRRSYERIRISRVEYKDNPYSFIDIRIFQRGFDEDENEIYYPTKKGVQFREDLFQELIGEWTLVPDLLFHQSIIEEVWPSMKIGKYDNAVFEAFKLVEIRVRKIGNFPQEEVGVALMRKAFKVDNGPLQNFNLPKAEQEAISHFFSGAIGLYKNPHSHRKLELSFKEAFEMVLVASHLLSRLDSIEEREERSFE